MKKFMVFILTVSISYTHGMDTVTKKFYSTTAYDTQINLTQCSIFDLTTPVDIIVVGQNQQIALQKSHNYYEYNDPTIPPPPVGTCKFINNYIVYGNKLKPSGKIREKTVRGEVLIVTEPYLVTRNSNTAHGAFSTLYYNSIPRASKEIRDYNYQFKDTEAIKMALKDLPISYSNPLTKALPHLKNKPQKSIAFPTLGTDSGLTKKEAALIAVEIFLDFINDHRSAPNRYDRIELCVKNEYEFNLYKELLKERCEYMQTIILLYCAYKWPDQSPFFGVMPHDVINIITLLIQTIALKKLAKS